MIVFDHTHPVWRQRYDRHGRTNGAFTYSRDICKWHLPVWEDLLGPDQSVSTCGIVPEATVQYLHERTHISLSRKTRLFVTTYKDLADSLGDRGLWIPNHIDADPLPEVHPRKEWVYYAISSEPNTRPSNACAGSPLTLCPGSGTSRKR